MFRIACAILLQFSAALAWAKDLGTAGAVYPIAEPDLLQVLAARAAEYRGQLQQQWREALARPQPVAGLSRTQRPRAWFFDPRVALAEAAGRPLAFAQQKTGAAAPYLLQETLAFYNADDPDQVRWAQRIVQALQGRAKLILVGGAVTGQMALFQRPVYFDQGGRLAARFQLRHVPALVAQDGERLKISEVPPL